MPVLHIYKLDSDEEAISKLEVGEHVIGRGILLQCDDRRVSRNHGIIKITQDKATITSTHINPCFYQPASSTTITILTKDSPMHLGNGDKFALLADQFWYTVKLEETTCDEDRFQDITISGTDTNSVLHATKREAEEEAPECSKKFKTEINNETHVFDLKEDKENIANEVAEESNRNVDSPKNEADLLPNLSDKKHQNCADQISPSTSTTENTAASISESNKHSEPNKRQANKTTKQKPTSIDSTLRDAKLKEMLFSSDEEDNFEIKNDPNNVDINVNQSDITKHPAVVNEDINKTESNKGECEDENLKNEQDPVCSTPIDETDIAGPSDAGKRLLRDRCWYGIECYRKSKTHLEQYCHPGDSDYESDVKDDRPVCQYGTSCYRRNADHRKAYKHPRNKQKPSKKAKRRVPRPRYNDTPEDDYDLDDPFINDSGSEYELDSNTEDSDSDWSEGSEEQTKRLLKEAKRFTKGNE